MISLGQIRLIHSLSITEARKKLYQVVDELEGDRIMATRLATITSEMARRLYQQTNDACIEVSLESSPSQILLSFQGTS